MHEFVEEARKSIKMNAKRYQRAIAEAGGVCSTSLGKVQSKPDRYEIVALNTAMRIVSERPHHISSAHSISYCFVFNAVNVFHLIASF